ncbi:HupE/UreJ family protein [Hirschia baltica]|uniref:HupE/UreJ protein n=1 Tax=Hirschia baltica (strain ATCC 49814 / DSM 5838 / IFAM 1418) TaxID=582402 RepID=C6XQA6_HIRBI|nr:HupE/UreJ family protein [Hirschia baltica]ACT60405.1 hypothetical protein Hbal_2732 [Hirschia baltica ATCC 49814]
MKHASRWFALSLFTLAPVAFAHPGHTHTEPATFVSLSDVMTGLLHPFSGFDHLLSILAISLVCVGVKQATGRSTLETLVLSSLVFAIGLLISSAISISNAQWVEYAYIALFAVLIGLNSRLPIWVGFVAIFAFGCSHSYGFGQTLWIENGEFLASLWVSSVVMMAICVAALTKMFSSLSIDKNGALVSRLGQSVLLSAALVALVQ